MLTSYFQQSEFHIVIVQRVEHLWRHPPHMKNWLAMENQTTASVLLDCTYGPPLLISWSFMRLFTRR